MSDNSTLSLRASRSNRQIIRVFNRAECPDEVFVY